MVGSGSVSASRRRMKLFMWLSATWWTVCRTVQPPGTVRSIELGIVQAAHGIAVECRSGGDLRISAGYWPGRDGLLEIEPADRVAQIHVPDSSSGG